MKGRERQITFARHGHILTNIGVWSPDSEWIVYDVRSDPAGSVFDGDRIERVRVSTGQVECLYQSSAGAHCGVVTYSPTDERVIFIHGPESPTPDWSYNAYHRRGVLVATDHPGTARNVDACNTVHPYTIGALRGGSHVHVFSGDGQWISFTYEDHVLATRSREGAIVGEADENQRNIGVSVPGRPVVVPRTHPRNHDGEYFSVIVTRTVNRPIPGTDQISRAYEDAWIGADGYVRDDGRRQRRALAFIGNVIAHDEREVAELFVVDLPDDLTEPGDGPLAGTEWRRPAPPRGVAQRRLTFTTERAYPGLQGPRHWPRGSPDGSRIGFLMRDDQGIVQFWTISPTGGSPIQVTRQKSDILSAFSWHPQGGQVAYISDNSVWMADIDRGESRRLTERVIDSIAPRVEACVFAPNGRAIAYVRPVPDKDTVFNQIFIVE